MCERPEFHCRHSNFSATYKAIPRVHFLWQAAITDTVTNLMMAEKHANKQYERALDQLTKEQKQASELRVGLEQRVMTTLEPQGASNLLMRGQQAALLQNFTFAQVMRLIYFFIDHVSCE